MCALCCVYSLFNCILSWLFETWSLLCQILRHNSRVHSNRKLEIKVQWKYLHHRKYCTFNNQVADSPFLQVLDVGWNELL